MNSDDIAGKISEGSNGLGVPSPLMVEQRARELAIADDRPGDEFTEADYAQARAELLGRDLDLPNDVAEETATITEWDRPATADGRKVANRMDDEENGVGEKLVRQGIEEAVHDEMTQAGAKSLEADEEV
ncbi:MAG: hypothetical protein M3O82_09055 [Verrucomicrobiota bacterium]|nr:hypothetical protein [Verrucomicrobiota bacterium]